MEFLIFGAWLPYFLIIMAVGLVLTVILLFVSNSYLKKKLKQIEQHNSRDS